MLVTHMRRRGIGFQSSAASVIHLQCSQAKAVQRVVHYHVYTKHPGITMNPSDNELCDGLWVEAGPLFTKATLRREDYDRVRLYCSTNTLVASTFRSMLPQPMCSHYTTPVAANAWRGDVICCVSMVPNYFR